ncbi:MAG: hypothetical protein QM770_19715 [Tepidisphaeraceae bacterium]
MQLNRTRRPVSSVHTLSLVKAAALVAVAGMASFAADSVSAAVITTGQNIINGPATLDASTRDPGGTVLFDPTGGAITGTFTLTNGILPYGFYKNSATSYSFATNGIAAYTGATAANTNGSVYGGIPSGGTGLINYDVGATTGARPAPTATSTAFATRAPASRRSATPRMPTC